MQLVYLETTFFSFYFDERTTPAIIAMREWTRQFWEERRAAYDLVTSPAVFEELQKGGAYHKKSAFDMALAVPVVLIEPEVIKTAQTYVAHKLMPQNITGDAMHLALASFHKCDYLVTWNCRHLANANKFGHIRSINQSLGLKSPDLVTPQELLGENEV